MTTPRFAEDTGRGRVYIRPGTGERLISVTHAIGKMDKPGLVYWAGYAAADHVLDNLPVVVARSRRERDVLRKEIARAHEHIRDSAADLGSRVHTLADAHLTGRQVAPMEGDDEAGLFVAQYLRFLKDFRVDIAKHMEASEATVARPAHGWAGTLDSLVWLALDGFIDGKCEPTADDARRLWLIDTKTSRTRAATQTFPQNRLQVAALRHAKEVWLPDGTFEPMPNVAGCAVLNLRPNKYELIPVPAATPEYKVFLALLTAAQWLFDEWPGEYEHRPVKPDGTFKPKSNGRTPR